MSKPKIIVVIPTVRPEQYKSFISAWKPLFEKHQVTLVTVWDGETPHVTLYDYQYFDTPEIDYKQTLYSTHKKLIYRYTDACRNLGFIVAAHLMQSPNDVLITLDDDVAPIQALHDITKEPQNYINDPIQAHLDVLQKRVPLGWMNTAHDTDLYLRGVPYGIRDEAPVMLSHGVWVGTPDFDGETQLMLEEKGLPYSLPYYVGPISSGVLFPLCGMNVAIKRDALPYFYFAPMGVDTNIKCTTCDGTGIGACPDIAEYVEIEKGCPRCGGTKGTLNRFADIWMGVYLKKEFDRLNWACYTGGSTILHTRASDAKKNFEQEKLGREWNEYIWKNIGEMPTTDQSESVHQCWKYLNTYDQKREQFQNLIMNIFLE